MNGTRDSAVQLAERINEALQNDVSAEVVLCPPAIHIPLLASLLADTNPIKLGAQNCAEFESGAYTGEVSAQMIREFACQYVIIGHSERRQLFGESSAQIAAKFQKIQAEGMRPILCVGEQKEHRSAGQTFDIIRSQLIEVVDIVGVKALSSAVLAYEPVWAIGTGLTATPEQAQEVHGHIREILLELDSDISNKLRILYGGSVKADNAAELFQMPDIDGGLVGGASLKFEEFIAICKAVG